MAGVAASAWVTVVFALDFLVAGVDELWAGAWLATLCELELVAAPVPFSNPPSTSIVPVSSSISGFGSVLSSGLSGSVTLVSVSVPSLEFEFSSGVLVTLDELELAELSLDELELKSLELDELTLESLELDELTLESLELEALELDELTLEEL